MDKVSAMDTMTNAEQKKAWMAVADHIARDVRSGAFVPGMWLALK